VAILGTGGAAYAADAHAKRKSNEAQTKGVLYGAAGGTAAGLAAPYVSNYLAKSQGFSPKTNYNNSGYQYI
jgi:hypothetical protein